MKLTDKFVAITILSAAMSPFVICLVLFLIGQKDAATLAAVYSVFGLPFVLIIGWLLSISAKNHKNPQKWTVLAYITPVVIINLAIIGISISS